MKIIADGWFYIDERVKTETEQMSEPLTLREKEVWELLGQGLITREIAERLAIADRTCEAHLSMLYDKLGLAALPDRNKRVVAALLWYGIEISK